MEESKNRALSFLEAVTLLSHANSMAFLVVYLDESGTHDGSPVVVVSGLISTVEQWLLFEKEWSWVLAKHKIDVFHRSELAAKQGKFKGWTEEQEVVLLGELTEVIGRRAPFIISHGVRATEFEEVRNEFKDINVSPYAYCCEQSVAGANFLNSLSNPKEPIQICFDQGRKYRTETMQIFLEATKRINYLQRYTVGAISFGKKNVVIPLQAADFIAYEMYRHFKDHAEDPERVTRAFLMNLLGKANSIVLLSRPEHIRNWFNMYLENRRMT